MLTFVFVSVRLPGQRLALLLLPLAAHLVQEGVYLRGHPAAVGGQTGPGREPPPGSSSHLSYFLLRSSGLGFRVKTSTC